MSEYKQAKFKTTDKSVSDFDKKMAEKYSLKASEIQIFSTGNKELDAALGGGFPVGRIIEVYGKTGAGKSTLAIHAAIEMQKIGGRVLYIDAEHTFNAEYAKAIGLDMDNKKFVLHQPSSGNEGFELAYDAAKHFKLIIIDSIAFMYPKVQKEKDIGAATMGSQAKLISSGMSMLIPEANDHECTVLCLNQVRESLNPYSEKTYTPGGNSFHHAAFQRIELKRKEFTEEKKE